MPKVKAQSRISGDQEYTQFVDTVGTSDVPYSFNKQQEYLTIKNTSNVKLYVSVSGYTNQLIMPNQKWSQEVSFYSFSIHSEIGVQPFEATAINYKDKDNGSQITVTTDGTGDYTSLRSAIDSITDSSSKKVYNVMIYEGTYDIMSYYSTAEKADSGFIGLVIPDYVNLIGVGKKENTILKGELADAENFATIQRISTLNLSKNNNLENLTVTAKNHRYAIHDESSNLYKEWVRKVKNCYFEHYGNVAGAWTSVQAWGEGCSDGSYSEFIDCEFRDNSIDVPPYSTHNNVGFAKATIHIFTNCKFINNADGYAIRFGSMNSGQIEKVIMNNCTLNGTLLLSEEVAGSNIDFYVSGSGNTKAPFVINSTAGTGYYTHFSDETMVVKNTSGASIFGCKPVKHDGFGKVKAIGTTDSAAMCCGITFGTISNGTFGVIKTSGYFKTSWIGLTMAIGDKLGIVNGALAVVTSGDYIGICDITDHVRLVL